MSASLFRYETFAELVHERFTVSGPHGEVELELDSVTKRAGTPGRADPFTLMFRGPTDSPLQQATYAFRHPRCTASIFIVPVEHTDAGYRYEAVFNP